MLERRWYKIGKKGTKGKKVVQTNVQKREMEKMCQWIKDGKIICKPCSFNVVGKIVTKNPHVHAKIIYACVNCGTEMHGGLRLKEYIAYAKRKGAKFTKI